MTLNNPMLEQQQIPGSDTKKPVTPNESAGLAVEGFLKILDPETQETLLETRA